MFFEILAAAARPLPVRKVNVLRVYLEPVGPPQHKSFQKIHSESISDRFTGVPVDVPACHCKAPSGAHGKSTTDSTGGTCYVLKQKTSAYMIAFRKA